MIRPIDKNLLLDSIKVYDQQSGETFEISQVRVQIRDVFSSQANSPDLLIAKATLFIDFTNSIYEDINIIKLGNIVEYKEERYKISGIEVVKAFLDHHLEVKLV